MFLPCDDVVLAIGQENAFPWIERDFGVEFDRHDVPVVDPMTFQSTRAGVFFGGDAAFGPKNIIWAVQHGHEAAISIHKHCEGTSLTERLPRGVTLTTAKMGIHEWSYSNGYEPAARRIMPHVDLKQRFKKLDIEVELGFSAGAGRDGSRALLELRLQTVFTADLVHRVRRLHRRLPRRLPGDHAERHRGRALVASESGASRARSATVRVCAAQTDRRE